MQRCALPVITEHNFILIFVMCNNDMFLSSSCHLKNIDLCYHWLNNKTRITDSDFTIILYQKYTNRNIREKSKSLGLDTLKKVKQVSLQACKAYRNIISIHWRDMGTEILFP